MESKRTAGEALERLVDIMARLRTPETGCPWDLAQDIESLRPYLLEEAFEVLEAMDEGDVVEHRKELGDLLLQIVFQARVREEEGSFRMADVCDAISDKLVHRHPHVFAGLQVSGEAQVLDNWAQIKKAERVAAGQASPSAVDGIPRALPALVRAARLGEKASRVGFDWPEAGSVRAKVLEELAEVDEAIASGDAERIGEELGDLLFATAQWARKLGLHPEDLLRESGRKFEKRFRALERLAEAQGTPPETLDAQGLDALWNEVKRG